MSVKKTGGSKGIKIPFRLWYGLAACFLVLPVIVFCAGYLRWYVGIPFALCFAGFAVYAVADCTKPASGKTALSSNSTDIFCVIKFTTALLTPAVFFVASSIKFAQFAQSTSIL